MATPTATGEGTVEVPAAHLMGSVRRPDQPTSTCFLMFEI